MKTLVVVPTYNEAGNLPHLVERLFSLGIPDLELLVVDDNSPDGTAAIAEGLEAAHPQQIHVLSRAAKEGLGPAYIAGYKEALRLGADVVIQMDADLSHPPEYIPDFLESMGNADVVVGSRYVPGGGAAGEWGLLRRAISRWGDLYVRWAMGLHLRDTKSGFKGFRREVLEQLALDSLTSKGFIFQAEVAFRCQKMGFRIKEVPFIFQERGAGRSKMSLSIMGEALWRSFRIRWSGQGLREGTKT
ncbi:MAG: polyprenol monophosphomannose synthase [Dehalococcoidia bacterium]